MIRVIKIILILACIGIYGYSAIDIDTGRNYSVNIDTGKPLSVVWPFETAIVGDSGELGLRIGPKIGRGWRNEAGGEATYRFYIPTDGKYYIWAYCLWFDECANAVFAKIDETDKAIIGNDPIYKKWHWVRGFDIRLKKGTHTLTLSNHSDHIAIQKVFFTNSSYTKPEDCELVFSDIFYDGFDGCDQGNFENWDIVSGWWLVQNPTEQKRLEENILIGNSEDKALIIYKGDDWSNYSLNVAVQFVQTDNKSADLGICFGLKDDNRYHQLSLRPVEQFDTCRLQIIRKDSHETMTLADLDVPWKSDKWHQVEIALNEGQIAVKVDNIETATVQADYKITGGIGFRLGEKTTVYFDDIHIRQIIDVNK